MQECNPPRNSWLQTHRDDGVAGAEQKTTSPPVRREDPIGR
jgi:hypothetical protein